MKTLVVGLALAGAAFVAIGWRAGVLDMIDPDYCFDHPHRPADTSFHEERLSLLPPGPECRFTRQSGETVVEGPGWSPAIVAVASIAIGLTVPRLSRRRVAEDE